MTRAEYVDTYRAHTRAMRREETRVKARQQRERVELCAVAFTFGVVVFANVAAITQWLV